MIRNGTPRLARSTRVILAGLGAGAAAVALTSVAEPTETLAAFADDVLVGAGFSTGRFGLETSLTGADGTFGDGTRNLVGSTAPGTVAFSTPISLGPGGTSYAPVYLRTSPDTTGNALVSISSAAKRSGGDFPTNDALWGATSTPAKPGFITYSARALPATASTTCNADVWNDAGATQLFAPGSALSAPAPKVTLELAAAGGSTVMVCLRFSLDAHVATAAPSGTNGAAVHPVWTFTGTEKQ